MLAVALDPVAPLRLTPREAEVYRYLLRGESNRHIADELGISVNTVKTHVSRILAEFRVRHRSELIYKDGVRPKPPRD